MQLIHLTANDTATLMNPKKMRPRSLTHMFSSFLQEKRYLLADGATGTNLFNMGLMSGDAPELWNDSQLQKIRDLYQAAVDAGSDIFLANSFAAIDRD